MSRIRIYELAKEAGMSSKALTDKLKEQGYDVKGASSSVDEEAAEVIRATILKSANTELVETRIDSNKKGSTVIRRRSKVIKRKAKAVEETPEPKVEETQVEQVKEKEEISEPVAEVVQASSPAETEESVVEAVEPEVKKEDASQEKDDPGTRGRGKGGTRKGKSEEDTETTSKKRYGQGYSNH